jgi:hypothetical protein
LQWCCQKKAGRTRRERAAKGVPLAEELASNISMLKHIRWNWDEIKVALGKESWQRVALTKLDCEKHKLAEMGEVYLKEAMRNEMEFRLLRPVIYVLRTAVRSASNVLRQSTHLPR